MKPAPAPHWPGPPQPALLACSGGSDSTALLHLALRDGWREHLRLVHFDHQLRPDSAADAAFVRQLAQEHNIQFDLIELDLDPQAPNLAERARDLRRLHLATLAAQHHCRVILLGHQRDDQAETILANLLRGSGLSGLSAIQPDSPLTADPDAPHLWRPLLPLRRAELRHWLSTEGKPWREDSSNAQAKSNRNRLRLLALPYLQELTGRDPTEPLLRLAELAHDDQTLLDQLAREQLPSILRADKLDCHALLAQPLALRRRLLALWLTETLHLPAPDFAAIERLQALAAAVTTPGGSPAATELPQGQRVIRQNAQLQLADSD